MLQHQFIRLHTAWYFKALSPLAPGLYGPGNKIKKSYSAFLMEPDILVPPQGDTAAIMQRHISVHAVCNTIFKMFL